MGFRSRGSTFWVFVQNFCLLSASKVCTTGDMQQTSVWFMFPRLFPFWFLFLKSRNSGNFRRKEKNKTIQPEFEKPLFFLFFFFLEKHIKDGWAIRFRKVKAAAARRKANARRTLKEKRKEWREKEKGGGG